MHLLVAIAQLSRQEHNLGNDELSNRARVGEGRVKDGNSLGSGVLEIDLVGTDTETSNDAQLLGGIENLLGQLCLGPDTDAVHILDLGDQILFT